MDLSHSRLASDVREEICEPAASETTYSELRTSATQRREIGSDDGGGAAASDNPAPALAGPDQVGGAPGTLWSLPYETGDLLDVQRRILECLGAAL